MKFNKAMLVRIGALFIVLANQIAIGFGYQPLPFSEEQIYTGVSTVATVVVSLITTYFDTDVTKQARKNKAHLKSRGMK